MSLRSRFKRIYYQQRIKRDIVTVSQEQLRERLVKALPSAQIIFMDGLYRLPSPALFKDLVSQSWLKDEIYCAQFFDCDKFAFLFKSLLALYYRLNNVGVVLNFTGEHAFNLGIVKDKEEGEGLRRRIGLFVVEPQTGAIWPLQAEAKGKGKRYKVDGEIILM